MLTGPSREAPELSHEDIDFFQSPEMQPASQYPPLAG